MNLTPEQRRRLAMAVQAKDAAAASNSNPLHKLAMGGETALKLAGDVAGPIVGGYSGLGNLLLGGDADSAMDSYNQWKERLSYEPRLQGTQDAHDATRGRMAHAMTSPQAQPVMRAAGAAGDALSSAGDAINQARGPGVAAGVTAGAMAGLDMLPGPNPMDLLALGITMPAGGPFMRNKLGQPGSLKPFGPTLAEEIAESGYQKGSGPSKAPMPPDELRPAQGRRRARATPEDRAAFAQAEEMLKEAGLSGAELKAEMKRLRGLAGDARGRHGKGWHPLRWNPKRAWNKDDDGNLAPNWRQEAPGYHINPRTGQPYRSTEKADRLADVEKIAGKMVAEVREIQRAAAAGDEASKFIIDQSDWYTRATEVARRAFGLGDDLAPGEGTARRVSNDPEQDFEQYMAVEGGMSPNTELGQQHANAREFWEMFADGELDTYLEKVDAHLAKKPDGIAPDKWVRKLQNPKDPLYDESAIPLKRNGKKFGMNGLNGVMALRNMLIESQGPGKAPKMRNFAGNLRGTSIDPTIDIWASRTVQRHAGLPRLSATQGAVVPGEGARPDKNLTKGGFSPDITGQYGVAADVFRRAATELGMNPSDLQALMWMKEKHLWESNRWSPEQEKPSLVDLMRESYNVPDKGQAGKIDPRLAMAMALGGGAGYAAYQGGQARGDELKQHKDRRARRRDQIIEEATR